MKKKKYSVEEIKKYGKEKNDTNLDFLIELFFLEEDIDIKREIVSSIGRQKNDEKIYSFINTEVFRLNYMDVVYQMYRTVLYRYKIPIFKELGEKIEVFYNNEVINKMKQFYLGKEKKNSIKNLKKTIQSPTVLKGDSYFSLDILNDQEVKLIFTSPPYYNARQYSDYFSYKDYLDEMKRIFIKCNRVLENGRFIIINISPIITKRPGREFESIRYPIHFDFHKILEEAGFYFVDEIIWIKPEASVPNRIGGFLQSRKPLSYKPNCISESIMVYRKNSNFLLDENIKKYDDFRLPEYIDIDRSNCWYIQPKSSKNHPAIFPEELCEKILKYYSYPGDVVLDPFAGSGTFGRVSKKMNRIPILCEKNNEYIKLLEEEDYDII